MLLRYFDELAYYQVGGDMHFLILYLGFEGTAVLNPPLFLHDDRIQDQGDEKRSESWGGNNSTEDQFWPDVPLSPPVNIRIFRIFIVNHAKYGLGILDHSFWVTSCALNCIIADVDLTIVFEAHH